ncbi:MAG TPA: hypothetical protein DCX54_13275 [Flavobacteriales bacterium]|nr:hypothetical protein [Flavobacteriales bacterium]
MSSFEPKTFQLRIGDLHYSGLRYGHGSEHIFYFHGFGQKSNSVKKFLSDSLIESYTIHSIGLFFHESTVDQKRDVNSPLSTAEFKAFVQTYTELNAIENFHLMGYSMGARLCFDLLDQSAVKSLYVIAPDGITKNIWQRVFTQSTFLNRTVIRLVNNSGITRGMTGFLHRIGVISGYEKRLIQNNIHSSEALKNVFNVWMFYSRIYPSFEKWINILKKNNIPHTFLFGKYDRIITVKAANKILKYTNDVVVVEDGHDLVKEKYSGKISDFFLSLSENQITS